MSMVRRSLVALAGVTLVAAVVAAVVAVVMSVTYTDGIRPGVAYPGISKLDGAPDGTVRLPVGALAVRVGSPAQEYDIDYRETRTAAEGAVIVPVSWSLSGLGQGTVDNAPAYQFQVTLVADGRRYDLQAGFVDEPATKSTPAIVQEGSAAAVVEGDGGNLSVEVEYDGLTQILDVDSGKVDAGLAAPYYAAGGLRTLRPAAPCSALSAADAKTVSFGLDYCTVGPVQLSPYLGGFGWVASQDESWVTVPYSFQVAGVRAVRGYTTYSVTLGSVDLTLDGRQPMADILRNRDPSSASASGVKIFRTSTTPKSVDLRTAVIGDANSYGEDTPSTRIFRTVQNLPLR